MALLEQRRKQLAEGLFDAARKQPVPFLPEVIGLVTSPTGAVIRDILHVWPSAFRAASCCGRSRSRASSPPRRSRPRSRLQCLPAAGPVPRPDVLIVARGGGSLEDLWAFNEEVVVRAAAASRIPLISAVGHETDTTLIDHAADRRAPTPTAAAELAVPVRAELAHRLAQLDHRMFHGMQREHAQLQHRLIGLARGLPDQGFAGPCRAARRRSGRAAAACAAAPARPGAARACRTWGPPGHARAAPEPGRRSATRTVPEAGVPAARLSAGSPAASGPDRSPAQPRRDQGRAVPSRSSLGRPVGAQACAIGPGRRRRGATPAGEPARRPELRGRARARLRARAR